MAMREALAAKGLMDFAGLLAMAIKEARAQFEVVLVDEFQDLTRLQLEFIKAISAKGARWFIGDPDQTVYSFRGSHIALIAEIMAQHPQHLTLATNFRSASNLVEHANVVIGNNKNRKPIVWKAHRSDHGEVLVRCFNSAQAEFEAVRSWLSESPTTRCALARTHALVDDLAASGLKAMTVHQSKGLEWDEVWVMGCEAALFPHPLGELEEERRLFFVAITRAKNSLVLSHGLQRGKPGQQTKHRQPSCFLSEGGLKSFTGVSQGQA